MTTWRLDDARQTLVLANQGSDLPGVVYWGACLPQTEDLDILAAASVLDVTGGMMDHTAPLSICPEARLGWAGQPGFEISAPSGERTFPRLSVTDVTHHTDPSGDGVVTISAADRALNITYKGEIRLLASGLVQTWADISAPDHTIQWICAPILPVPSISDGLIDYSGRWIGEFQQQSHTWRPGVHMREAVKGRSGHEHPPFASVTQPGTTLTQGQCWSYSYDYSGGHRMIAEELPDGRRQLQFGHAGGSYRKDHARTATVTAAFGQAGLNSTAIAFQRHIRAMTAPMTQQPRPVHYNCWEAIYFDHSEDVLRDIAQRAVSLGAERFVLDDGWFGLRDDDTTSLGDWQIDPRKWPNGLTPFADYVRSLGMGFGLWVEPEMINMDSDLYGAHPEWLLGPADQPSGRQQYVLDMAQDAVCEHLFQRLDQILQSAPIEYLKWDHNRLLPAPDAAQVAGIYGLLDKLQATHPSVEIESCASGGGRIDLGILQRTQRVWLSDSNDALERLRIQNDSAQFLPACVTGSHVGPRVCHTSGRILDIRFRAWVAAQRHMGFEMDPRELTPEDAEILTDITTWWKSNRDWMMSADILRLETGDDAVIAEMQLAQDGHRFVSFVGVATPHSQIAPRPLCLTGLDPASLYEVTLRNSADAPRTSRGEMAMKNGTVRLSGQGLMTSGLALPWQFPQSMWVLEGKRLT